MYLSLNEFETYCSHQTRKNLHFEYLFLSTQSDETELKIFFNSELEVIECITNVNFILFLKFLQSSDNDVKKKGFDENAIYFIDFYSKNIITIKQKMIVTRLKTPIAVRIFSEDGIRFDQFHCRVSSSAICKLCMEFRTKTFSFSYHGIYTSEVRYLFNALNQARLYI